MCAYDYVSSLGVWLCSLAATVYGVFFASGIARVRRMDYSKAVA